MPSLIRRFRKRHRPRVVSVPPVSDDQIKPIALLADISLATIFSYLDLGDVPSLTRISHRFNQTVHSSDCDILLWSLLVERYCPAVHQLISILFPSTDDDSINEERRELAEGMDYKVVTKSKHSLRKTYDLVAKRKISVDMIHHDMMRRHFETGASPVADLPPEWDEGRYFCLPEPDTPAARTIPVRSRSNPVEATKAWGSMKPSCRLALLVEIAYGDPRRDAAEGHNDLSIVGYLIHESDDLHCGRMVSHHGHTWEQSLSIMSDEATVMAVNVTDRGGSDRLFNYVDSKMRSRQAVPLYMTLSGVNIETGWQKTLFRGGTDRVMSLLFSEVAMHVVDANANECRMSFGSRIPFGKQGGLSALISIQVKCRICLGERGIEEQVEISIGFLKGTDNKQQPVTDGDMMAMLRAI